MNANVRNSKEICVQHKMSNDNKANYQEQFPKISTNFYCNLRKVDTDRMQQPGVMLLIFKRKNKLPNLRHIMLYKIMLIDLVLISWKMKLVLI